LAIVELAGLTKAYNGAAVVSQVNLKIASGEFFSLLARLMHNGRLSRLAAMA
jgi:ABC-type sugar transport system ATPase subunit